VRDLKMSTTTFVSRASGPDGAGGDAPSDEPSISADGRFVAFQSVARNLGDGSLADGQRDIFVRDVQQDTTTFVSRAAQPADGSSLNPSISADGRYVAFESFARNLSDDDADGAVDIFVRDRQEGTTTYVSRGGDANSYAASVSADGRFVAFGSDAALDPADVDPGPSIFVRDLGAGTTRIVSGAIRGGALDASLSPDGRFVVFEQEVNDAAGEPQPGENIFVHDLVANTTAFVGRASPEPGEQEGVLLPYRPSISSGGRFVAFASEANSLSAEDDDAVRNVFVRDLRRPATSPPPAQPGRTLPPRAPRCAGRRATIVGTPGRDRLRGTRRADVIVALGGNDRVTAGRGRDLVCGGRGNDRLFGGRGRDRLIGGPGRDRTKQ
jgi:Tol biopolymer transport system component